MIKFEPLCIDATKLFVSSLKISSFASLAPPTRTQSTREQILLHFQGNFDFDFELTKLMAQVTHITPRLLGTHILIMPLDYPHPFQPGYLHACPCGQARDTLQPPKRASAYSTNDMKKNPQSFLTLSYRA